MFRNNFSETPPLSARRRENWICTPLDSALSSSLSASLSRARKSGKEKLQPVFLSLSNVQGLLSRSKIANFSKKRRKLKQIAQCEVNNHIVGVGLVERQIPRNLTRSLVLFLSQDFFAECWPKKMQRVWNPLLKAFRFEFAGFSRVGFNFFLLCSLLVVKARPEKKLHQIFMTLYFGRARESNLCYCSGRSW